MSETKAFPDQWSVENTTELYRRIESLSASTQALWGKMNVSQMLAHCAFPYLQALGYHSVPPKPFMRWMVKTFFKKTMTNLEPYKQSLPTNPSFLVVDQREFEKEKENLKKLISEFQQKGSDYFDGKAQMTLGKLSAQEWNNTMYKHIDHHLRQFGV